MIELREVEGLTCPVAICDACGEMIRDGRQGLYVWDVVGGPLRTAHKGQCDRSLEGDDPKGGHRYSMELTLLPVYLGRNIGMTTDEAWKRAMESADFGI